MEFPQQLGERINQDYMYTRITRGVSRGFILHAKEQLAAKYHQKIWQPEMKIKRKFIVENMNEDNKLSTYEMSISRRSKHTHTKL